MNKEDLKEDEAKSFEPHKNDVLCGRGGSINNHIGNENYRIFVNRKKRVYLTARFKREKRLIAASIVKEVRSLDPPGRFLAKDSRSGVWYDIGDLKARDKTSQALREGAPEIRKEMESDRKKQKSDTKTENDNDDKGDDESMQSTQTDTHEKDSSVKQNASMKDSMHVEEDLQEDSMQVAVSRMNIHDQDPWAQQHNHLSSFHRDSKSPTYNHDEGHFQSAPLDHSHAEYHDMYSHHQHLNSNVQDRWYSSPSMEPTRHSHQMNGAHPPYEHSPHNNHVVSPIHSQFPLNQQRAHYRDMQQQNTAPFQKSVDHGLMPPPQNVPMTFNSRKQFRDQQRQNNQSFHKPLEHGLMPPSQNSVKVPDSGPYSQRFIHNVSSPASRCSSYEPNSWNSHREQMVMGRRPESDYKLLKAQKPKCAKKIDDYLKDASGTRHTRPPSPPISGYTHTNTRSSRQEQINVANKLPQRSLEPVKYKQIVETRAEPQDWFCGSLIPADWQKLFSTDDASFCGFDICSVNSLGGGSLCGVFIEDDPKRNTVIEIANQNLKEAKSWGSLKSKSSLGSLGSGDRSMFSCSSTDKSLISKGSDKGLNSIQEMNIDLQPLPHDDRGNVSFTWSLEGKVDERRTE